jgi:hypothetical protein
MLPFPVCGNLSLRSEECRLSAGLKLARVLPSFPVLLSRTLLRRSLPDPPPTAVGLSRTSPRAPLAAAAAAAMDFFWMVGGGA